jgi:hypothetical protein
VGSWIKKRVDVCLVRICCIDGVVWLEDGAIRRLEKIRYDGYNEQWIMHTFFLFHNLAKILDLIPIASNRYENKHIVIIS